MILVLSNDGDECSTWLCERLAGCGCDPVLMLTSSQLAGSRDWEHRIDRSGARVAFTLPDGQRIVSGDVRGTVNRLLFPPASRLLLSLPADRSYVQQEWMAFFLSWIQALPDPVLNRPTGQSLSGEWRHRSQWTMFAVRAGLPIRPYAQDGSVVPDAWLSDRSLLALGWQPRTLLVIAGRVIGDAPPRILDGVASLARMAATPLLGIDFAERAGEWVLAGATPQPDLRLGGESAVAALVEALSPSAPAERRTSQWNRPSDSRSEVEASV